MGADLQIYLKMLEKVFQIVEKPDLLKFLHKSILLYSITRVVPTTRKQALAGVGRENLRALHEYYERLRGLATEKDTLDLVLERQEYLASLL